MLFPQIRTQTSGLSLQGSTDKTRAVPKTDMTVRLDSSQRLLRAGMTGLPFGRVSKAPVHVPRPHRRISFFVLI